MTGPEPASNVKYANSKISDCEGSNVTVTVQLRPAASDDPEQVSEETAKSVALAPDFVSVPSVIAMLPTLVNATERGVETVPVKTAPKSKLSGEAESDGGAVTLEMAVAKCGSGVPAYSAIVHRPLPSGSPEAPAVVSQPFSPTLP